MNVLRTPEARFADLLDFPWPARYVDVEGPDAPAVRMAWVEAGQADGPVVVLLHGEPSWSFLYRKMIAPLAEAGCRVLAPDLIGFGRSDKPTSTGDQPLGKAFERWREFCLTTPTLEIGALIAKGTARGLDPAVQAAYDAPFPDETYKAGARVFPALVPASPDDPAAPANRAAWASLMRFEKPFVTAFGDSDSGEL